MAAEKIVTTGVVKGNTIMLDEPLPLPEGSRVTVAVGEKTVEEKKSELYERLIAEGLLAPIPQTPPEQIRKTVPVEVKGKPLSQMIIEERR